MASSINASTSSGVVTTADNSGILNLQSNGVTVATIQPSGLSLPAGSTFNSANTFGFKNRLINGNMVIDQRNAGAAVTVEGYSVDRWRSWINQTYSIQQVTDAPTGFSNSLRVTKTSTTQSTYGYLIQYVEGFNFADMMFGTANAKTVTISFWVKSSVTGTFTAGIGNSAPSTRFYPASYVINSANTWEQKSITIAGDTTGTWAGATNAVGASVYFNFGTTGTATANAWQVGDVQPSSAGSANLGTTNGATFYITGVQLEVGSQATSFDFRSYGTELALCQRYFISFGGNQLYEPFGLGQVLPGGTNISAQLSLPVSMRTPPSLTSVSPTSIGWADGIGSGALSTITQDTASFCLTMFTCVIGFGTSAAGRTIRLYGDASTAGRIQFSAEL
jgi:hypothetical protein